MTEERTTPLRERMIEDMRIRGMGENAHSGASGRLFRRHPVADSGASGHVGRRR
jgi:hypothetical protein